ncbi:radical SAM/SPASM domain-containing protein [Thermodesulfobacteriota bacterium]
MDGIVDTLVRWHRGEVPPPYGIELSPTLRCNLDCLFCWRYGKEEIDTLEELPIDKYLEIIEDAAGMGVTEFKVIGGGDACVRLDTIEILEGIKRHGMFGYLCTNGTLFRESDIDRLVDCAFDHIKISFHGSEARTHDNLAGRSGAYDKVLRNVRRFGERKGRGVRLPRIEFGVVLGNRNAAEVPEIVRLAVGLGVEAVFIEPVTVYSDMGASLKLDEERRREFEGIARRAKEIADAAGIETNLGSFFESTLVEATNRMIDVLDGHSSGGDPFIDSPCFEPFYRVGIRVDGRVGPCGFFDEAGAESIRGKRLEDVWRGEYFQKRRAEMLERRLGAYCSRCCTTLVDNNRIIREKVLRAVRGESRVQRALERISRRISEGGEARKAPEGD